MRTRAPSECDSGTLRMHHSFRWRSASASPLYCLSLLHILVMLVRVSRFLTYLPSDTCSWLQNAVVDALSVGTTAYWYHRADLFKEYGGCVLRVQGGLAFCKKKSAATEICEVCRTGFLQVTATAVASLGRGGGRGGSCTGDPHYILSLSFKIANIASTVTSNQFGVLSSSGTEETIIFCASTVTASLKTNE
jgi:hypothetical protein